MTAEWSDNAFFLEKKTAKGACVLVCDRASVLIPEALQSLGLPENLLETDIAWDAGELALKTQLAWRGGALVLATVHSFTPVFLGQKRGTEIGILFDEGARVVNAMLTRARQQARWKDERNAPYRSEDGVTHTLQRHALPIGLLNVLLGVRNDLLMTSEDLFATANLLNEWIMDAVRACSGGRAAS